MKTIPLTKGKYALVDDADYAWLSERKWRFGHYYAETNEKGRRVFMHRLILEPAEEMDVDHVDGNGLNNCRANLRACTRSQNMGNQRISSKNTSGYKGVSWRPDMGKFHAYINIKGKRHFLGYHLTAMEAAQAYDVAAIKFYGEFARLNFNANAL